jgi:hypothetical protein
MMNALGDPPGRLVRSYGSCPPDRLVAPIVALSLPAEVNELRSNVPKPLKTTVPPDSLLMTGVPKDSDAPGLTVFPPTPSPEVLFETNDPFPVTVSVASNVTPSDKISNSSTVRTDPEIVLVWANVTSCEVSSQKVMGPGAVMIPADAEAAKDSRNKQKVTMGERFIIGRISRPESQN